jgi:hypothetical protein
VGVASIGAVGGLAGVAVCADRRGLARWVGGLVGAAIITDYYGGPHEGQAITDTLFGITRPADGRLSSRAGPR